ncbi:MAG: hypothetical protein KGL52_03710 [Rhodospirillales bacterium]|nr:hypothetical protein [Rhodospirillales bacterium]
MTLLLQCEARHLRSCRADLTDWPATGRANRMELKMKKFLAAFLMLGLLVSAGATAASAAQNGTQYQNGGYQGPGQNG